MGFLDNLSKGLDKVGKKTSEMANVAKLKIDITKFKTSIDKKYEGLGLQIYTLSKEGMQFDDSIKEIIVEIDDLFVKIKDVENLLNEERKYEIGDSLACPNCGEKINKDTKFCGSCGAKIENVVSKTVIEKKVCPNCGEEVEGSFCNSCGTNLE